MAYYPCDRHGGRYTGPQRTAYCAIVNGTDAHRVKLRLCADCFFSLRVWLEAHASLAGADSYSSACIACDAEETPYAVFATLYDKQSDREDWWARACDDHAKGWVSDQLLGAQKPLPGPS